MKKFCIIILQMESNMVSGLCISCFISNQYESVVNSE